MNTCTNINGRKDVANQEQSRVGGFGQREVSRRIEPTERLVAVPVISFSDEVSRERRQHAAEDSDDATSVHGCRGGNPSGGEWDV